jgi:hypothetical protein
MGHSADVEMELILNGTVVSIAQLGPDFLILREPFDHPPSHAELVPSIDGKVRRWAVALPDGVSRDEERVRIAPARVCSTTLRR